jgi:FixJ family two-component response regulator
VLPPRLLISVIDDEEPVRKALGRLFTSLGFGVETFSNGPEFLSSLQDHRPDCAILDLHLPGLSGLEVQERLGHEHISFPVIIVSGRAEPGLPERARAAGAAAFLSKPLEEQDLLQAIASVTHGGIGEDCLSQPIKDQDEPEPTRAVAKLPSASALEPTGFARQGG